MNLRFWRRRPKHIRILINRMKGDVIEWVWSPRQFDEFFAGSHVYDEAGVTWGIAQLSPIECVKVIRGTNK